MYIMTERICRNCSPSTANQRWKVRYQMNGLNYGNVRIIALKAIFSKDGYLDVNGFQDSKSTYRLYVKVILL